MPQQAAQQAQGIQQGWSRLCDQLLSWTSPAKLLAELMSVVRVLLGLGLLLLVLPLLLPSDCDCVAALRFCCTAYPGIELPPRASVGFARPTGLPACITGY